MRVEDIVGFSLLLIIFAPWIMFLLFLYMNSTAYWYHKAKTKVVITIILRKVKACIHALR